MNIGPKPKALPPREVDVSQGFDIEGGSSEDGAFSIEVDVSPSFDFNASAQDVKVKADELLKQLHNLSYISSELSDERNVWKEKATTLEFAYETLERDSLILIQERDDLRLQVTSLQKTVLLLDKEKRQAESARTETRVFALVVSLLLIACFTAMLDMYNKQSIKMQEITQQKACPRNASQSPLKRSPRLHVPYPRIHNHDH